MKQIIGALIASFSLVGCEESFLTEPSTAASGITQEKPTVVVEMAVKNKSGQTVTEFTAGDEVVIELIVKNSGATDAVIDYTAPGYDLYINKGETRVWDAFYGVAFLQVMTQRTLAAGEEEVITHEWTGVDNAGNSVGAGSYEVSADIHYWVNGVSVDSPASIVFTLK